jgi:hypothetical protein
MEEEKRTVHIHSVNERRDKNSSHFIRWITRVNFSWCTRHKTSPHSFEEWRRVKSWWRRDKNSFTFIRRMKNRKLPMKKKKKRQDDDGTNEWWWLMGFFFSHCPNDTIRTKEFFFGPQFRPPPFFDPSFSQTLSAFALCTYPLPGVWISTFTDTMVLKFKKK